MKSSYSGGTVVVSIAGRLAKERERLIGMTDEERAWRARFLKSQELAPEEPLVLKEYYKQSYNPIRRFYKAPLNVVEGMLVPVLGTNLASTARTLIARLIMGTIGAYSAWYYFKYHTSTWERPSGWRVISDHPMQIPGTKGYKGLIKPKNFATYGFENSPI